MAAVMSRTAFRPKNYMAEIAAPDGSAHENVRKVITRRIVIMQYRPVVRFHFGTTGSPLWWYHVP